MNIDAQQKLLYVLNEAAEPISASFDYSSLIEKIGNARIVLIGEATHGRTLSVHVLNL